jgi:purine-binding chemotaxis protein CheW
MADTPALLQFGVFRLAGMQLALHQQALREVAPMGVLTPVPSECPSILGAISLRGLMVPVMDVRRLLEPDVAHPAASTVVVIEWEGRVLGLAADSVVGVYVLPAEKVHQVRPKDALLSVLQGGFERPDAGSLVSLLCVRSITRHAQLPMTTVTSATSASQAEHAGGSTAAVGLIEHRAHLMLFRSHGVPMAVATRVVHTTISEPELVSTQFASGMFLGMMRFGESEIPAVQLGALCGLQPVANASRPQAFVVKSEAGFVAFLVDSIIDVVQADAQQMAAIPRYAPLERGMFSGTLPQQALVEQRDDSTAFYLLLSEQALTADPRIKDLGHISARRHSSASVAGRGADDGSAFQDCGQMLIYHVGFEVATPLRQVVEILGWSPELAIEGLDGASLIMSRGRPVPVFCLATLLGGTAPEDGAAGFTTSVLLVADDGELVGFKVPRLVTIDRGRRAANRSEPSAALGASAVRSDRMDVVLVGLGADQRVLRHLDLVQLARGACRPVADVGAI